MIQSRCRLNIAVTRDYYDWDGNSERSVCLVSSEDDESFEDGFSDQARKKALEIFDHQPETTAEEYDFKQFFTRILEEKDWTDKLESAVVKVRHRLHPRNTDTKLPKGLLSLIPDMNEVAKAYKEMTTGYKEFIQNVLDAKQSRASKTKMKAERSKSTEPTRHRIHPK